ncbi:hypothetical protein [Streptomyces sp. NBC_01244]|uniref:hypothetical protein n=1 Tax=Streptomyces sp. NBC_01244 TaxID=2903797 RepID=UPI002E126F26|nr:hypothetical protein OG247_27520 [Streptomyces sp. NBC_01244]
MDLHPCECGGADFGRRHQLERLGDDLVAVYEGVCRGCGRDRRFEFVMAVEVPPPPPAYGGAEPSEIIDPGEFSDVADRYSRWAGLGLLNSPGSEHHKYQGAMASALAAVEEVFKFIPEGQDAVPASAFTSARGRARYEKGPGKFSREILEIELDLTREVLADIDNSIARSSGGADPAAQ